MNHTLARLAALGWCLLLVLGYGLAMAGAVA